MPELGRIEIDGDNLFINNVNPECVARDKQVLELHRDYIDVHILLEGTETIGWKAIEDLKDEVKPYEANGDCALYSDAPTTFVDLLRAIHDSISGGSSCSSYRTR